MLHIVMYHYVRNNEDYEYDCYARRWSEFESQVDFIQSKLDIASPSDLDKVNYFLQSKEAQGCLLTFDDGYKDHLVCSDLLASKNLKGIFFPPINAIKGELLDINAIHRLIGTRGTSINQVLSRIVLHVKEMNLEVVDWKGRPTLIEEYLQQDVDSRLDDAPTIFIKRLLQRDIRGDENRRNIILDCLEFFSGVNPSEFAKNLYLSDSEMQQMNAHGMLFGSHGVTHRWLNNLTIKEQEAEIINSFAELKKLSLLQSNKIKVMCYPYGAYNSDTLRILNIQRVDYALTTQVGAATISLNAKAIFELKRWDTNDFWDKKWNKPAIP